VAGRQGGYFIEEEQLSVAIPPDGAMAIIEGVLAADPLLRCSAPRSELLPRVMQPAAAVAHHEAARGAGDEFAEWRDAIWQRHVRMAHRRARQRNR